MSQIKFYGRKDRLPLHREQLSRTVHACVMDVLGLPANKRAHRFIRLESEDFLMPEGRSEDYTIIEIQMIEGRTTESRKRLIKELFKRIEEEVGIKPADIEICILQSKAENWGFRGFVGDEVQLNYQVEV